MTGRDKIDRRTLVVLIAPGVILASVFCALLMAGTLKVATQPVPWPEGGMATVTPW